MVKQKGKDQDGSEKGSNFSDRSRREEIIGQILTKSRLVCSLPPLEASEFVSSVGAWCEILEDIHTSWLNTCYARAMKIHSAKEKTGPFKASDLVAIWSHVQQSGEFEAWLSQSRPKLLEGPRMSEAEVLQITDKIRELAGFKKRIPGSVLIPQRDREHIIKRVKRRSKVTDSGN